MQWYIWSCFYRSKLLLKYYYWAENDRNSKPGIAVVELNTSNIYIEKIAVLNFQWVIPNEDYNKLVDSITV